MRKVWCLGILGAFCLMAPVTGADVFRSGLLTREDFELEQQQYEDHQPALSSVLGSGEPWESYNRWLCFSTQVVDLTCSEVDYAGLRKIPSLRAHTAAHRFEFDLSPEFERDCDETLQEWGRLIGNSTEICVFAAHLQAIDEGASLWYFDRLKSRHGDWIDGEAYESPSY